MSDPETPGWVENRAATRWLPDLRLGEIWSSRELTYFFFFRDLKVQYKQTLLGAGWVVLGPLMGALTFTFLFNWLAEIDAQGSYFLFAFVGFMVWGFVSQVAGASAESLLEHEDLITHVAFPKISAPLATIPLALVDLVVALPMAVAGSLVLGQDLTLLGLVIGIPAALPLMTLTALGPGLYFAAAIVKYRDAGAFLGIITQLAFLLAPVAYPANLVDERWRTLQFLNPVTGSLALFRWGLNAAPPPTVGQFALSALVATLGAMVGFFSFRRNERLLVDVI